MKEIKIKISDSDARRIYLYLRDKYKKTNNISLERLCEIAIRKEVAEQAKIELEEISKEI